jgi:hypothetical protein
MVISDVRSGRIVDVIYFYQGGRIETMNGTFFKGVKRGSFKPVAAAK